MGDLLVGLLLVGLEHVEPFAALHLGAHLLVIEPVRALLVVAAVARRRLVVVEHADRARHPPVRDVRFRARLGLALAVILPVRLQVLGQEKVGRQRMEVALSHQHDARRERRHHRAHDLRPRLLVGLGHDADAEIERHGARGRDLVAVVGKVDVVGRTALPDGEDDVDRLGEHLVAILVEDAERLGVGGQRAGAHAQDEAAFGQMIEHRRLHRDQHGVHMGEVRGAGGELDPRRRRDQRGVEHHAVGDGLAGVGEVLAHEGVVETELVGQDDGLAVLLERLGPVAVHGVHRHGEVAQPHSRLRPRRSPWAAAPKRLMCPICRAGTSINL